MKLDRVVVDTRRGGGAEPLVVLFHGFMGRADDLAAFARSMGVPALFVFPEGPIDLAPEGLRGRAWWPIDLDARCRQAATTGAPRDLSAFVPARIGEARAEIDALMDELQRAHPHMPLIVGGFSQGAMLSCDWALRTPHPPEALVQLSGARICADAWRAWMSKRPDMRAFVSHGRADDDLSFAAAEAFQGDMVAAGWEVTWFPFDGGHEIPLPALRALKKFLRSWGVSYS